jgi:hypothetical protein
LNVLFHLYFDTNEVFSFKSGYNYLRIASKITI